MPGGSSPMAFGAGIIRQASQSNGTTRDNDMTTFLLYQADTLECTSNNVRFDQLSFCFISPWQQTCACYNSTV
jgi:hypothetical protein